MREIAISKTLQKRILMKQTVLEATPQWGRIPITPASGQEFKATTAAGGHCTADQSGRSNFLASFLFPRLGIWQQTKSLKLRKSNRKKEERLAFEKCVWCLHTFILQKRVIFPAFKKNSAPSGFYKQWLVHLHFLQWVKVLLPQD